MTYFSAAGNEGQTAATSRPSAPPPAPVTGHRLRHVHELQSQRRDEPRCCRSPPTSRQRADLIFQFDQPFQTQEPAGSPNVGDLERQHLHLDAQPATSSSGHREPATTSPPRSRCRSSTIPTAGSYFVAIQVVSGPNPGHVEFVNVNDTNVNLTVSQQFGSAGGTFYPSSVRARDGGQHDRRRRDPVVGTGAVPGPEPAGQRAIQLARARRSPSSIPTALAMARPVTGA